MFAFLTSLVSAIDYLQSCLTSGNLQIVLLIGSGVLAIGLLILALTRWGHSRPVWKCVILSVIAHILLIAYAWGTHLIAPAPVEVVVQSEPMRINFEEESGKSVVEIQPTESSDAIADWDQFSAQSPRPADVQLARPAIDSEVIVTKSQSPADAFSPSEFKLPSDFAEVQKPKTAPLLVTADLKSIPPTDQLVNQLTQANVGTFEPVQKVRSPDLRPETIEITRRGNFSPIKMPAPNLTPFSAEANTTEHADIVAVDSDEFQLQPRSTGQFEQPTSDFRMPPLTPPMTPAAVAGTRDPRDELTAQLERSVAAQRTRSNPMRNVAADYATPRRLADGQPLPSIYSLRNAPNRREIALQRGGSQETEAAVELALAWLAENQSRDGRWNPRLLQGGREDKVFGHDREGAGTNADTGITALAVLAFLANGYSHLEGPYQDQVKQGLEYLVSNQASDGSLAGRAKLFARMYCHSMSLLAISEAYAMTGDRRLAVSVQRGVNYSVSAQDPKDGGWRYQPGDDGDMSQFGWQVLALHSAELAGIDIPKQTQMRMGKFLNLCCISPSKGIAAYRPGHGPNTTMTAEALVCRHLLKQPIDPKMQLEATDRIMGDLPSNDRVNMYFWYYGTMAMYLTGGDDWHRWNQQMKTTLLDSQVTDGADRGSWNANGLWAGYGGRTYSTAMAALTLEVYYRYLPIYEVARRDDGVRDDRRRAIR